VRQGGDNFSLDRNSMGVNLVVECFAEGNCIFGILVGQHGLIAVVKPKVELVEKVKTR